jgi:pimeloyl-ACP methyl ester carboxylesterase
MREEAVRFGNMKSLIGIVTGPVGRNTNDLKPAVILLNPGIVHRVAPGRIYVKIARALAANGFVIFRFDFSGIGDSAARHDSLRFEQSAVREAQEAMDFLRTTRGIERFIFLGGCSGARIALETACCDPRVVGGVLINFPIVEDEDGNTSPELLERKAFHYYRNFALSNLKSWRRLLTGQSDYRQVMRVLGFQAKCRFASGRVMSREATQFEANLGRLADRGIRLAFLCSEGDPRFDDLQEAGGIELKKLCKLGKVTLDIIPRSDHTFSSLDDQEKLLKTILERVDAISLVESDLMVVSRTSDRIVGGGA